MTEASHAPTDEELHEDLMEQLLLGIHVAMPGRIQSYDAEHQVADIIIGLKHTYPDPLGSGEYLHENYPVLPSVAVLFPRMGKWFMAMSVEPGDAVQVLFNSSAIGMWRRSTRVDNVEGLDRALQGISLVGDVARHHLTHAVALLGLETFGNPIRHAPPTSQNPNDPDNCMTLGHDADDGVRLSLYRDGRVTITRGVDVVVQIDPDKTVHIGGAAGEFLALANLVNSRLSTIADKFDSHTHIETGGTTNTPAVPQRIGTLASVAATKAKGT